MSSIDLCILPVNQEDASPGQTSSHHLSLRLRRKVVGKLVISRHSCLTLGSSFLSFWRFSPSLALTWSRLLSTFPGGQDILLHTSLHQLPGPLYHSHKLLPHLGQVHSQVTGRLLKWPLHVVCFKQDVRSHQRETNFS